MANDDDDNDFDSIELMDEEEEIEFSDRNEDVRRSLNARRILERRMELKRLREMLDYPDLDDID
jgi:hypothetical protein